MTKKRDIVIDIARGIAIVLMVAANMAVLSNDTPPMIFRFFSSLAAPFFVTLAGTMAALGVLRGNSIHHFTKMGLFLFIVAALLDVSTNTAPLVNFDVLYLIGVSLPIAALSVRLSLRVLITVILAIILVTPLLHYLFGYVIPIQYEMYYHGFDLKTFHEAIHRILIDGWFPIFPWLSFALIGVLIGKLRYGHFPKINFFQQKKYIIATLIWLCIGCLIWIYSPGLQVLREGYVELFYPAVPGFVIFTTSVLMSVLVILAYVDHLPFWKYIQVLGEASLFMYLFHLLIIEHVLMRLVGSISFGWFYVAIYVVLMMVMIVIGLFLQRIKSKPGYKSMPYVVKRLFGG